MTDLGRLDASSGSFPRDEADDSSLEEPLVVPTLGGGLEDSDDATDESDVLALELDRLITEYFDAQREGRAPSVEDYVAAHPEHEHALRAVLPGANLLDQMGKRAEDASPQARSGDRLGEYKLLGILGRGGMGVVYEAVQETLGRPVALKVLPASRVVDRKSRERFMREAQAAASLQHPGIVPVYGVGEADGQVYYAMQRVDGVPLDVLTMVARGESAGAESSVLVDRALGVVSRLRGEEVSAGVGSSSDVLLGESRVEPRSGGSDPDHLSAKPWIANAVRIAQQIAEALSYAHSRGVLHRDVKPSNVMLDESGRAYVTDFGLCKVEDSSSLTAAGDVVGTLRYVPPERFQGRDDARGDVYGVGMILYELLCGRPAYDQRDRATLVQAVTLHSPPKPRKLNTEIPEDLERIILAATAKLPEERYLSAEALIADLSAFQSGRPIRARAPGKLYLAKLFARRNQGLVVTAIASLIVLAVVGVMYVRNLGQLLTEVEAGRTRAERLFYHAQVHAAVEAARNVNGGAARALRILDSIETEQRDWVWKNIVARCDVGLLTVDEGAKPIRSMVLDAAEEVVAVVRTESVRVHVADSGEVLATYPTENARSAAFVPGTRDLVVVQGEDRELRFFAAAEGGLDAASEALRARVAGLALTDIRTLDATPLHFACSTGAGRAVIFDRTEGWAEALFEVPTGRSARLALFGQEGRAAYSVMRRRLRVLGPEPGRVRRVAGGDATQIRVLDGAWEAPYFAAHSTETHYTVRYLDQDEDLVPRGDRAIRDSGTTQLAISPDGLSLIAQFRYGKAQIWEKSRGPSMARVAAYLSAPTTIVWPKGGEAVLVGGSSGEWRLIPRPGFDVGIPGVSEVRGHFSDVTSFSFDSDGKHFAVAEESGVWSVWSVDRHLPQATNVQGIKPTQHIAISSTEGRPHRVAVAGEGVGVWTLNPDQLLDQALYTGIMSPLACCGIAWRFPDDSALEPELLSAGTNGRIYRSWLPAGKDVWESKVLCSIDATLTAFDHHQGAGVTVVGSDDGRIWRITQDRRSGALRPELMADMGRRITSVGIGTLAEAVSFFTGDEHLHLIDMNRSTPELRWSVEASAAGSQEILSTAIAVDEASGWIVTAGADGAMQLWSLIDGMSGPLLEMRFGYFRGVEFPRPNSAPISVEARGRVTFIETEGANRMLELAAIEPTQAERLNVMFLAPRVRLAEIGKALDAGLAGRVELESMRKTVEGLQYVARFYEENVPSEMADAMLERVEAALQSLDDAN